MKISLTLSFLALVLWGCNQSSGPSGPPDLTMKDVVGCWSDYKICSMECFDRRGGYYSFLKDKQGAIYEHFGSYVLISYKIDLKFKYYTVWNSLDSSSSQLAYLRTDGFLKDLNSDGSIGSNSYELVTPDSFACATPWQRFQKPAGWDSLIRPLP